MIPQKAPCLDDIEATLPSVFTFSSLRNTFCCEPDLLIFETGPPNRGVNSSFLKLAPALTMVVS